MNDTFKLSQYCGMPEEELINFHLYFYYNKNFGNEMYLATIFESIKDYLMSTEKELIETIEDTIKFLFRNYLKIYDFSRMRSCKSFIIHFNCLMSVVEYCDFETIPINKLCFLNDLGLFCLLTN